MHLAARMVRDRPTSTSVLATMAEAGIDDAFVIGGDATPPLGPYASAGELLPLVHEHPHRPRTIGIGGYPEGHPLIDDATLAEVLQEKSRSPTTSRRSSASTRTRCSRWVRRTRVAGIELPVLAGVPGIVDRRKLLEISMRGRRRAVALVPAQAGRPPRPPAPLGRAPPTGCTTRSPRTSTTRR